MINSLLWILHLIQILCCLQQQLPILGWAPQTRVPNCLISHLTFIQFKGLRGFPDELSFVEYVLQKGLVLKTMIIAVRSLDLEKNYSVVKTLTNVPRASTTCQLTFDWVVSPKVWFISSIHFLYLSTASNQKWLTLCLVCTNMTILVAISCLDMCHHIPISIILEWKDIIPYPGSS